jgi:hypothetical protein
LLSPRPNGPRQNHAMPARWPWSRVAYVSCTHHLPTPLAPCGPPTLATNSCRRGRVSL